MNSQKQRECVKKGKRARVRAKRLKKRKSDRLIENKRATKARGEREV